MPAPTNDPKGDGKGNTKGDPKGGKTPKGDAKGKGKGEAANGEGKGKGEGKRTSDPNRSCFGYLFGTCAKHATTKHGTHCGAKGGLHRNAPTEAEKASEMFKKFEARHGQWSKAQMTPKANAANSPPASPRPAASNNVGQ